MFVAKTSDATSWHELMQKRSASFPQSFVRQPNDLECTQIVRNAPKRQFRVQWVGWGVFVVKSSTRLRGMNFWTSSARFFTEFRKATKRSRMHTNSMKCTKTSVRVQRGGSGVFFEENSDATSWDKLLH